jgi:hypothetical protein
LSMWASAMAMMYFSDINLVHMGAALWMGLFFQQW